MSSALAADLDWYPIAVLPTLDLSQALECKWAALAPYADPRVAATCAVYPRFAEFVHRFSDCFGVAVTPTTILVHRRAPKSFLRGGGVIAFRDLCAACSVPLGRALTARYSNGIGRLCYSDALAIYPWMIDKNYETVISITEAQIAQHEVSAFQGQSSASLSGGRLDVDGNFDEILFKAALPSLERAFTGTSASWRDVHIWRALNMAYQACLMASPANDSIIYDRGRLCALWVSAFEILVHGGAGSHASKKKVLDLLANASWQYSANSISRRRKDGSATLPQHFCDCLYSARNDFLHGNPVTRRTLRKGLAPRSRFGHDLVTVGSWLFRIALGSELGVSPARVRMSDLSKPRAPTREALEQVRMQGHYETALIQARFGEARSPRRSAK